MKKWIWGSITAVLTLLLPCFLYSEQLSIPQGVLVASGINAEFVAKFSLFIGVLLLWTVVWGKILKITFKLPVIAGQIIAGVLLGPSGVNIAGIEFFSEPYHIVDQATGALYALASSDLFVFFVLLLSSSFTVAYLLWIAGHETDIKDIFNVGISASTAGILGALIPIGLTVATARYLFGVDFNLLSSTGFGLILAATSVSIPVAMLFSQNKMHLRSSKATLGAAIIDDIFAIVLLSLFFIFAEMGVFGCVNGLGCAGTHAGLVNALVYLLLAFVIIFLGGYFIVRPLVIWLHRKKLFHLVPAVANSVMFFYFAFAELVGGLAGITGAYFAGLFHRMGDTRHHAEKVISPFVNAVLLPLFLCSIGLQVDIKLLNAGQWIIVFVLLIVAIVSKLLACFLATGLSNMIHGLPQQRWNSLESFIFGSSMVARGEVGLVVATILNSAHIITPEQYVIAVVVIVLTTVATPIMLSVGFSYQDEKKSTKHSLVSLNLGIFDKIGTERLFNIIENCLDVSHTYQSTVQISEGRKILTVKDYDVKVILVPGEGIILEGNKKHIDAILTIVHEDILKELERCKIA